VLLLRKGNGAAVMKKRMVLGVLPAIGLSAIPTLACPACLPALASILGVTGLTFLIEREYFVWVNLVALVLALAILFMKRRANGYAPFLLGAVGAVAIMLGKFVLTGHALAWSGLAALIVASAMKTFGRKNTNTCNVCGNHSSVGENQYGKEKS
jgi:hypothetical protein